MIVYPKAAEELLRQVLRETVAAGCDSAVDRALERSMQVLHALEAAGIPSDPNTVVALIIASRALSRMPGPLFVALAEAAHQRLRGAPDDDPVHGGV